MSFFNFVDQVGPAVPASYLNALDNIRNVLSATQGGFITFQSAPGASLGNPQVSAGTRLAPLVESSFADCHLNAASGVVCWTCHNVSQATTASCAAFIAGNDTNPIGPTVGPAAFFTGAITSSTWNTQVFSNVPTQSLCYIEASPYALALGLGSPAGAQNVASLLLSGTPGAALMQFQVAGAGVGTGTVGTNALVDMTPDFGQFTGTVTGTAGQITGTFKWERIGRKVHVWTEADILGTSNATTMTITGLSAAIIPAATRNMMVYSLLDSGVGILGGASVTPGGVVFLGRLTAATGAISSTAFTASGSKGLSAGFSLNYSL